MALVKSPLFSEEAHGALGGVEYRLCRGKNVVGRRSISTDLATPAQLQHRSLLKLAHDAWSALPLSDQAAWCQIAPPPLTGRNEYVARWIRCHLILADPPIPYPPPIHPSLIPDLNLVTADPASSELLLQWTSLYYPYCYVMFSALGTYSHRQNPTISKLRFRAYCPIGEEQITFPIGCAAPVVHLLLKTLDQRDGSVLARQLYRFEPVWS